MKIVGFIAENTFFYSRSDGLILLDDYILKASEMIGMKYENSIGIADNIVNQSFIESTDIKNTFKLINGKSSDLNLYTKLLPLDLKSQSNAILYSTAEYRKIMIPSLISMIVFAAISITASVVNLITGSLGKIAVHLKCGANFIDIYLRYICVNFILLALPYLFSVFLSVLALKYIIGIPELQSEAMLFSVSGFVLFFVVISMFSVVYINKMELSKILKREYSI